MMIDVARIDVKVIFRMVFTAMFRSCLTQCILGEAAKDCDFSCVLIATLGRHAVSSEFSDFDQKCQDLNAHLASILFDSVTDRSLQLKSHNPHDKPFLSKENLLLKP